MSKTSKVTELKLLQSFNLEAIAIYCTSSALTTPRAQATPLRRGVSTKQMHSSDAQL